MVSWEEVKKHTNKNDLWIVVDGDVLDITQWARRHPGGNTMLKNWAGQDATEAFKTFHPELDHVTKLAKTFKKGEITETIAEETNQVTSRENEIRKEFELLRQKTHEMGLYKPSVFFFALVVTHFIALEVLSYLTLVYCGTGWIPWTIAVALYATAQSQAGWSQHDFGHISVLAGSKLNHIAHWFVICFFKGAGSKWWNTSHYLHHAKPNVIGKDPDINFSKLFIFGEELPKKVGKSGKSSMPYNFQHVYFVALLPLLLPILLKLRYIVFTINKKKWIDLFGIALYYTRVLIISIPLLGVQGTIAFHTAASLVESFWFLWCTQSNHIPMEISYDKERNWLEMQLFATCNVDHSPFNDWFTGHLNFQIEHHLFPTMPRHNYYKVAPLVKSLCAKYNVPYLCKPLFAAFIDITKALKHSGDIWKSHHLAYEMDKLNKNK